MRFSLKTRAVSSRSRNIGTKSSYSSRHFFANSAFSFAASFFFSRSSACTFFRLRFDFFCSSFSKRSSWFRPFVSSNSASSPLFFPFVASRIAFTAVYVILRSMFTTDSQILCPTIIPFSSISIRQLIASLSHPAFREQIPLESLWGSIGITRSTRWFPACTPPHREDSSPLHNGSHPRCERRDGRSSPRLSSPSTH